MDTEIAQLARLTHAASELLRSRGEHTWGAWLRTDAERIRQLDFYGIEHVLAAFGGMGSLNDLVLHPQHGHHLTESEISAVNDRMHGLLQRIYTLAEKLTREEDRTKRGP